MAHRSQVSTRPDAKPPPGSPKVKTVACLGGVSLEPDVPVEEIRAYLFLHRRTSRFGVWSLGDEFRSDSSGDGAVGVLRCRRQYDHPNRDSVDGQPAAGLAVTDAGADSVQKGLRL
jgi:hypothetical protein